MYVFIYLYIKIYIYMYMYILPKLYIETPVDCSRAS